MKVNGSVINGMAKAHRLGVTARSTQVNGKITKLKGLADSYTPPKKFTRDTGRMTKLMDTESTLMSTAPNIKVSGSMIYSMVSEKKLGLIIHLIMAFTAWAKKMVLANISGATDQNMLENGCKIVVQEQADIHGWTGDLMKVNGITMICKAQEFTGGLTIESSQVNIIKT